MLLLETDSKKCRLYSHAHMWKNSRGTNDPCQRMISSIHECRQVSAIPPLSPSFQNTTTKNISSQWVIHALQQLKEGQRYILLILYWLVGTSDILNIVFGLVAALLSICAIWATRRYNNPARGNDCFLSPYYLSSDHSDHHTLQNETILQGSPVV